MDVEIESIRERGDLTADVKERLEQHIRMDGKYGPIKKAYEDSTGKDYEFFRALNDAFNTSIPDLWNSGEAFLPKMWKFHQIKSNYYMKIVSPLS